MDQIIKQITDLFGQFWDSPLVQLGLKAIAIYFVILWLAAAYWAFRDMQLRTNNPILPYFAASLIIIFTPVFFVFAVIAYRIVRPQEKIGETYERTLAEEALLAEVEAVKSCPTCARRVDEEWIICPTCRTRLNRVCPNCSRLVGLDWSLCAWCGRDFERAAPPAEAIPAPRPAPAPAYGEPTFAARPAPAAAIEASSYRATMSSAVPIQRDAAFRDVPPPDFVRRDVPTARLGVVRDDGRTSRASDDAWAPPPPPPAIVPPPPATVPPPPAIVPPPAAMPPSGGRASTSQARQMRQASPRASSSSASSAKATTGQPPASTDPLAER